MITLLLMLAALTIVNRSIVRTPGKLFPRFPLVQTASGSSTDVNGTVGVRQAYVICVQFTGAISGAAAPAVVDFTGCAEIIPAQELGDVSGQLSLLMIARAENERHEMNIPGFTAEHSLRPTMEIYRASAVRDSRSRDGKSLMPQARIGSDPDLGAYLRCRANGGSELICRFFGGLPPFTIGRFLA